ncbi:hypothetical protein HGM15179_008031 [Zosterops borbonicus]|uniref:Uncharacterized protein n=1 Tax=Zosterops borbonicus TaxID=364589 RepID=A0A8K1LML1_9PASS|nr:hypothetical protein HGM15179_008031 [Zosterops borbonicus]
MPGLIQPGFNPKYPKKYLNQDLHLPQTLQQAARRNSFLTTMPISSTFWCHKRNEINIRQTLGIDIRKEPSRNETTGLDEIREGHRKEIRTIQPTLDTWTA